MSAEVEQSRLERWSSGRLSRIDFNQSECRARLAEPLDFVEASRILAEIEALSVEESLIRLLVADREVGVLSMATDLQQHADGTRASMERSRIKAEATLSFLRRWGHMLTDQEFRQAVAGPGTLPYAG